MNGIYVKKRMALGQPGGEVWDIFNLPVGPGEPIGYIVRHPALGLQAYTGRHNVTSPRQLTDDERRALGPDLMSYD